MKTRAGFVSNSSTSSFVLIVSEDDYRKGMRDARPLTRHIAERITATEGNISGMEVRFMSWATGNRDSFEHMDIPESLIEQYAKDIDGEYSEDYKWDTIHECWDAFVEKLSKTGILTKDYC